MLSKIQMNIIIRALQIRIISGEDPTKAIKDYTKLTDCEQNEILQKIKLTNND